MLYRTLLSFFVFCGVAVGFQNCGALQSAKNTSVESYQDSSGFASEPPTFLGEDDVVIGDMIVNRAQISLESQQQYFPHFYKKSQIEDVSASGVAGYSLWPEGLIPIEFTDNTSQGMRDLMFDVCDELSGFANIRCIEADSTTPQNRRLKYIADENLDCGWGYAKLGYQPNGSNTLRMGAKGGSASCHPSRLRATLIHELIHNLGFGHAHNHPTRDQHLIYYPQNVDPQWHSQFFIIHWAAGNVATTEYDSDSRMHYWSTALANEGSSDGSTGVLTSLRRRTPLCELTPASTISAQVPDECKVLRQKDLSEGDRRSLILAYGPALVESDDQSKRSCELDGVTVADSNSYTFYSSQSSTDCSSERLVRICDDSSFSGDNSFRYANCTNQVAADPVRPDIRIYLNDVALALPIVKSSTVNSASVHFKSDETNQTSTAVAHGHQAASADKHMSWALNRYYYSYCEAKTPNGNNSTYFNRCLSGLKVHSKLHTDRSVELKFETASQTYLSTATTPEQALSTLFAFLIDEYGDSDFNSAERAELLSSNPAPWNVEPIAPVYSRCTLDGVTIEHGDSHLFYIATASTNCSAISRSCNNGDLSGSDLYRFRACQTRAPASDPKEDCSLDGITVAHNDSRVFYSSRTSPDCSAISQNRNCNDGLFSGDNSYRFSSCQTNQPVADNASCTLDGLTVEHGQSYDFFMHQSSGFCEQAKITRTCDNGVLSGSNYYRYTRCVTTSPPQNDRESSNEESAQRSCEVEGRIYAHGLGGWFYLQRESNACMSSSVRAYRTCNNGAFDGAADEQLYLDCSRPQPSHYKWTGPYVTDNMIGTQEQWNSFIDVQGPQTTGESCADPSLVGGYCEPQPGCETSPGCHVCTTWRCD